MLDMARKAVSETQGLSREAYDADANLRLALIHLVHLVQVIGEAARQVSQPFTDSHPESPCRDVNGQTRAQGLTRPRQLPPCRERDYGPPATVQPG
jgi:uncharacterized protein with HEPN domain